MRPRIVLSITDLDSNGHEEKVQTVTAALLPSDSMYLTTAHAERSAGLGSIRRKQPLQDQQTVRSPTMEYSNAAMLLGGWYVLFSNLYCCPTLTADSLQ